MANAPKSIQDLFREHDRHILDRVTATSDQYAARAHIRAAKRTLREQEAMLRGRIDARNTALRNALFFELAGVDAIYQAALVELEQGYAELADATARHEEAEGRIHEAYSAERVIASQGSF